MGRKDKDMTNKAKAPSQTHRPAGEKTKHRKGGDKVRKTAPTRRLNRALDQFIDQNHAAHVQTSRKEAMQHTRVRENPDAALSGPEFQTYLRHTNVQRPDPKKLARQLLPNYKW